MISNKLPNDVGQKEATTNSGVREGTAVFGSSSHRQQQYDDGLITVFHKSRGILSEKFILDTCTRLVHKPLNRLGEFTQ